MIIKFKFNFQLGKLISLVQYIIDLICVNRLD